MKHSLKKGFTLVEILIVVIILGILAAIVIPQFTQASGTARISNVMTNLQTIRSQLLLYKTQHNELFPGSTSDATLFGKQMTLYSDVAGATVTTPDTTHPYGPYLQSIPSNPLSNVNTVRVVNSASATFTAPTTDGGWYFNMATGEFRADVANSWKTADGTNVNAL